MGRMSHLGGRTQASLVIARSALMDDAQPGSWILALSNTVDDVNECD